MPAFAAVASSARISFQTARSGEAEAFRDLAIDQASTDGTIVTENCLQVDKASACEAKLIVDGTAIDAGAVGPTLAADADKLATYAEGLKDLATAHDLADRRAALHKLSSSVGAVFSAAGVPGVAAVGSLISDLVRQQELHHRRQELLEIATVADPAVQYLALSLQNATILLQKNIVLARSQTVSNLESQFATMERGSPGRTALAKELIEAAQSEHDAAALKVDLTSFGKAHTAMIASLSNAKPNLQETFAEVSLLVSEINDVKSALGPKGGSSS